MKYEDDEHGVNRSFLELNVSIVFRFSSEEVFGSMTNFRDARLRRYVE